MIEKKKKKSFFLYILANLNSKILSSFLSSFHPSYLTDLNTEGHLHHFRSLFTEIFKKFFFMRAEFIRY